jgi:hypothetical protein
MFRRSFQSSDLPLNHSDSTTVSNCVSNTGSVEKLH